MRLSPHWPRAAGLLLLLAAWRVPPSLAQQTVTGRVTDQASGAAVIGARIVVDGTSLSTESNALGRYSLTLPGSGRIRLRVFAVGYAPQLRELSTGTSQSVDFQLVASVIVLDEIVSTATGDQRRLELGHTVGVVRADSVVARSAVSNLSDVLNSRVAGMSVQTQTGTVGGGSRVRIRGANSISLNNEPVVLIDGVRVDNSPFALSIGVGGQASSRLNDLNPDEIESIEVIKGPSASTLYGTEAANGVIAIKTKRGAAGRTVWNLHFEAGRDQDKNAYPDNFNAYGVQGGIQEPFCALYTVAAHSCLSQDSVVRFNPMRDPSTTPLASGFRNAAGLNVSGGTDQVRYYLGGNFESQLGVFRLNDHDQDSVRTARGIAEVPSEQVRPNTTRKVSFRTAVTAHVAKNVDVDASLGYVQNRIRLPESDNNALGVLGNALLGSGYDAAARWAVGVDPAAAFSVTVTQLIDRLTGSIQTRWLPAPSLAARLVVGLDRDVQSDVAICRAGEAPNLGDCGRGSIGLNKFSIAIYSADASLSYHRSWGPSFGSKTTVGGQFYKATVNGALATGNGIAAGSNTIDGAVQQIASSQNTSAANGGVYLEQNVSWRDQLFVGGAVRLDQASAFARTQGSILLPKASVSWIARDRPGGWLTLLRARGSYGRSLVAPGALVRLRTYRPVTGVAATGTVAAVTFGSLGNDDLKPERSREIEAGVDASFFKDRLSVELTVYDKLTRDALVNRPLAPSLGVAPAQFYNIGSMRNRGLELGLAAQLLSRKTISLDLTLTAALLKNRLESLGAGVEPFALGFTQRMVPGLPAGGFWDKTVSFDDANHDGLLGSDEVTVSDTAVYIGPVLPTREFTITPALSLWSGRLRIASQWNYRGGHFLDNTTEYFRCAIFANCRALYDPKVSLADQGFATAVYTIGGLNGNVQKADFLRLRELSLTVTAPQSVARLLRATNATLTVAGRNLALWTKYRGPDPETSAFGGSNFETSEFLTLPPLRSWVARINLGF